MLRDYGDNFDQCEEITEGPIFEKAHQLAALKFSAKVEQIVSNQISRSDLRTLELTPYLKTMLSEFQKKAARRRFGIIAKVQLLRRKKRHWKKA